MKKTQLVNPDDFIISKKRKKYKFAWFANLANCFEADAWRAGEGRYIVELGAGDGRFALELARRYPDHIVVAVDVKADRLQACARVAMEAGPHNVVFVRAHAEQLVELFAGRAVDELWLTFSDPFPKKRHAKHRLTHPRLLAFYRTLLGGKGVLNMKTDNLDFFQWSLERLVGEGWRLRALTFDLHESDFAEVWKDKTAYEEKFISAGIPIKALQASPGDVSS